MESCPTLPTKTCNKYFLKIDKERRKMRKTIQRMVCVGLKFGREVLLEKGEWPTARPAQKTVFNDFYLAEPW